LDHDDIFALHVGKDTRVEFAIREALEFRFDELTFELLCYPCSELR